VKTTLLSFFALTLTMVMAPMAGRAQDQAAIAAAEKSDFLDPIANRNLLESYEKDPGNWPDSALLPVAICYARKGSFAGATDLYRKFLVTDPTSARGIRGLGNCLALQQQFDEAAVQFKKAWELKDASSLGQLGMIYVMQAKWEEVDKLVPDFLANRQKDIGCVNCLIAAAMVRDPKNKTLFYQTINGLPEEYLLQRADTRDAVFKALQMFGDEKRLNELKGKVKF